MGFKSVKEVAIQTAEYDGSPLSLALQKLEDTYLQHSQVCHASFVSAKEHAGRGHCCIAQNLKHLLILTVICDSLFMALLTSSMWQNIDR